MTDNFNPEEAKKYLNSRAEVEKEEFEKNRLLLLDKTIVILKEEFIGKGIEVYLVGSIVQPFRFTSRSDVDIVLKNFMGDRFDLWTRLENKIGREVEIILFETCHFQTFIEKEGFKVI